MEGRRYFSCHCYPHHHHHHQLEQFNLKQLLLLLLFADNVHACIDIVDTDYNSYGILKVMLLIDGNTSNYYYYYHYYFYFINQTFYHNLSEMKLLIVFALFFLPSI